MPGDEQQATAIAFVDHREVMMPAGEGLFVYVQSGGRFRFYVVSAPRFELTP